MIVKEILSEELLTLAEAKEILNRGKKKEEERYEKRRAIEHANKFAKIGAKESRKLVEELLKLEKMKLDIAIRIADLLPRDRDELRAIYAKERFALTESELDEILGIVKRY
jgi:DNA-directed RNA polymerase subunit F